MPMKIRVRWLASQVAATGAILSLSSSPALCAGDWYTNYEDAVKAARREGKPIFADFSTEWCPQCRRLERNTLTDQGIVQRLDGFIKVHIDAEKRQDLTERYQVKAYPTLVTMDPSGNAVNKSIGYVEPRELAGTLDSSMMAVGPSVQQQKNEAAAKRAEKELREKELADAREKEAAAREKEKEMAKAMEPRSKAPAKADLKSESSSNSTKKAQLAGDDDAANSRTARAVAEAEAEARRVVKGGGSETMISQGGERKMPASAVKESMEELPRPMLSRTGSGAPQISKPVVEKAKEPTAKAEAAGAVQTKKTEKTGNDPLATVRMLQAASKSEAPKAAGAAPDTLPGEPVKVVAMNADAKAGSVEEAVTAPSMAQPEAPAQPETPKPDPKEEARKELEGFFKEADAKLVAGKKKEARALYEHVVDKDPDNSHGKSDVAFVRMVSLIVDQDDDALRKKAYNRIREFEARYPNSKHKDYYTLIRATLAADLGDTNAAHRLLDEFATRFPESKFQKQAHETWKTLPPVKKESMTSKNQDSAQDSRT
jgi:thioredoxin-related protein